MDLYKIKSIFDTILLIIILIIVILIYIKSNNEHYCNCFGMQYNGLPLIDHPGRKPCSKNTTKPLYREGGCAEYDPSNVQTQYIEGKFTSAV